MISAAELTRALNGRWHGRYGTARCIVHDDHHPSLAILDGEYGPILKCHAGCEWRDIRSALRRRGIWDARSRQFRTNRNSEIPGFRAAQDNRICALALWDEAKPLTELPLNYFGSRGITDLSALPELRSVLRFHLHCPFRPGERHPCILGLWTDALTGEPRAIHRTALNSDGTKLDRMSLGPTAGCVIRLWPDEVVTIGLVIGEGIETTLAAATRLEHRGTLLQPAWAVGDKGHLATFPVLAGIEALTILVDNDESRTGQRAARECVQRWTAAGREVTELIPNHLGCDFNNIVRKRAHA